ncbi:hypothetical protein CLV98_109149 [Dyadobacter jejuensis]|uniref:Uncharacterized protein n=1 Tax=Dyadobacter jejuensis TaxID=1082580 RepID=A0A316AIG5_9BACT|nr:hypothetical protein [Dyadobacter jejuensis]PWJ57039.1 hypothetical protein CLV98_109149 [Dyadobacter jejuensis]
MMVAGEGQNPGVKDLMKLAEHADLSQKEATGRIERVQDSLSEWNALAKEFGVMPDNVNRIAGKIN